MMKGKYTHCDCPLKWTGSLEGYPGNCFHIFKEWMPLMERQLSNCAFPVGRASQLKKKIEFVPQVASSFP